MEWIERILTGNFQILNCRLHLCGGVDWKRSSEFILRPDGGPHLCGGVDWKNHQRGWYLGLWGLHLCGGVDWKAPINCPPIYQISLHLCGGVDWKVNSFHIILYIMPSPPVWWSGLKGISFLITTLDNMSPPVWWSGLKVRIKSSTTWIRKVSTCVVEWIERDPVETPPAPNVKSPPVWWSGLKGIYQILVVVFCLRLHLCGGVDWKEMLQGIKNNGTASPPVWWSGLKDLQCLPG